MIWPPYSAAGYCVGSPYAVNGVFLTVFCTASSTAIQP
jgi:hypothetical protein